MRFLLIGNLTPAVAAAIVRHGHVAATPESIGLTDNSSKDEVLKAATKAQVEIVTADPDLAEAPYALDRHFPRTIIFLQLAGGDVEQDDAIDRLFGRYKRLTPKRLYTVTENRVKVRQLPGAV
jgi:predicted nuclease of predicted toxin-antitoxin system